jgi:predicted dehydrogenase
MSERPVLRLGWVGLGQSTRRIFENYSDIFRLPYRITAGADPREDARVAFQREFNAETYTSAEELCSSPNVDVVYIATPPQLHCQHVLAAVEQGKHVLVEKPMALSIADCERMNEASEKHGVRLLAAHTHSFDAPLLEMAKLAQKQTFGKLLHINTWMFNSFNMSPWPQEEVMLTRGTILNQGPHQVDLVRQIAGGVVASVRAATWQDNLRECEGGYACYLQFENGVPATLVFDSRGFFDTGELTWWLGESGDEMDPEGRFLKRQGLADLKRLPKDEMEQRLREQKDASRYGGEPRGSEKLRLWSFRQQRREAKVRRQPFFGLTIVSCEHAAIRQSPDGLFIYGDDGVREIDVQKRMHGRAAELTEMYHGIVHDTPIFHDGRWGEATLEVCLGILQSAAEGREIVMEHQVPLNVETLMATLEV